MYSIVKSSIEKYTLHARYRLLKLTLNHAAHCVCTFSLEGDVVWNIPDVWCYSLCFMMAIPILLMHSGRTATEVNTACSNCVSSRPFLEFLNSSRGTARTLTRL